MRFKLLLLGACALATSLAGAQDSIEAQRWLADLSKANTTQFSKYLTSIKSIYTEYDRPTVRMQFGGYKATFGQEFSSAQNWSSYPLVCIKVHNRERRTLEFRFIVQVSSDPSNYSGAFNNSFKIGPGQTRRFIFHLNKDDSMRYGLEYLNPVLKLRLINVVQGNAVRDFSKVFRWRISYQGSSPATVDITDMRLIRQAMNFDGIIDKFGQYARRDWPGKVTQPSDILAHKAEEMTDLAANPGPGELDGTSLLYNANPMPGRWRIRTSPGGMRYFQHPSGKLFWSFGVSGVHEGCSTPVTGRENFFTSLPSHIGYFASCWEQKRTLNGIRDCYSFWTQNLMIKYGADFMPAWNDTARRRLKSWGFNTLGIQCDPILLDGFMPFTLQLDTDDFPVKLVTPIMLWGPTVDPFAAGFRDYMTAKFTADLAPYAGQSNLMGLFVDNEISWGDTKSDASYFNLPLGAIVAPSTQPAKLAFVHQLSQKYGSISGLNSAWGTRFSSFQALLSNTSWHPTSINTNMATDFKAFIKLYASSYYSQVRAALDATGTKALYLGSRFCNFTQEVVDAATPSVDVLSFNFYRPADRVEWDWLNHLGKPVLISEIGYGTQDRGTFGGPAEVSSHEERAQRMREFFGRALSTRNIVGVHWYSYADQPITGRWSDFENSGMGLVDTTDQPYSESIEALREFSSGLYARRG